MSLSNLELTVLTDPTGHAVCCSCAPPLNHKPDDYIYNFNALIEEGEEVVALFKTGTETEFTFHADCVTKGNFRPSAGAVVRGVLEDDGILDNAVVLDPITERA